MIMTDPYIFFLAHSSCCSKHLPPIDDPLSALYAVGQQAGGSDFILPQDLLYKDLKVCI